MSPAAVEVLRAIPAVGDFLASAAGRELGERFGSGALKLELRAVLEEHRNAILKGRRGTAPSLAEVAGELEPQLTRLTQPGGRRAINATGIMLHTGLGRAPLCAAAITAMQVAAGYTPLQANLESGDRSLREEKVQRLLQELVGCEAATMVNNNAAATMLVLHTLAGGVGGSAGKEVIISRGQLIEIGGSFRMTDVMAQSGAVVREVGTTNRTHLRDYEGAINEKAGAIIHVHTSNYRIRGFTSTPEVGELAVLARKYHLPLIADVGSGALVPLSEYGISDEPLVKESLAAGGGADIACFSGDKLISGPQAGIICGKAAWIEKIRKSPYARMFRVCKLTLAGLEATLLEFLNGTYRREIPFYRMLGRKIEDLEVEARAVAEGVGGAAVPGVGVLCLNRNDTPLSQ